ncbi:hypothetical protein QFZ30_003594 [Arthrobacter pascens]|uniref:hypothetical protein n=1 Tax=Arthrobacter pascens TaxID=1677 RepID=UPI00278E2234|nr:hypothetical protein [Arthrobacter pascens]MDQ0680212.1 hypothetical protein [Arthrobacter pascens]
MDRRLHALVKLDVVTDVVRIEVRGSLNEESRPCLVHIVRRVRRMGVRSHIRVDLTGATFIESTALAGLRNDLNAIDGAAVPGTDDAGVTLELAVRTHVESTAPGAGEQALAITDEPMAGFSDEPDAETSASFWALGTRPLAEFSDDELLAASDSIFALLDTPETFAGSDLLARYTDIGQEISRRRQADAAYGPAAQEPAAG